MFAASKSGRRVVAATDPFFPYVSLLLNTTSTNGQQNNTFLDSSTNNFTITRSGTPTQGSITPYWPNGYWSNLFNGSSHISATSSSFDSISTAQTIEFWIFAASYTSQLIIFELGTGVTGDLQIYHQTGTIIFGKTTGLNVTATPVVNSWNYIACVKNASGTSWSIYLNGSRVGGPTNVGAPNSKTTVYIGARAGPTIGFVGYISNLKITAAELYTGATMTVPTAPSTITNSPVLLTSQSNRFIDNSSPPKPITVNGTPRAQAFQPFSPTDSYTTALYGGSGYFGGTGNYLTASAVVIPITSTTFTIECWIYPTATPTGNVPAVMGSMSPTTSSNDISFGIGSSNRVQLYWYDGGVRSCSGNTTVPLSTWTHLAASVNSNSITLYVNGVSQTLTGTTTLTNRNVATGTFTFGQNFGSTHYYTGYISNARVVNGVAVYTGTFTPPTLAPLTTAGSTSAASYPSTTNVNTSFAASSTNILTNYTNAGIYDAAVQNNEVTVGSAQTSITQYKWSPTSMRFNGTTDYLTMPVSPGLSFGIGNFTIEAWIYNTSSASTSKNIFSNWGGGAESYQFYLRTNNRLVWQVNNQNSPDTAALAVPVDTWTHVAWTRSGNTAYLHINGVLQDTTSLTNSANGGEIPRVGAGQAATQLFPGYIQDLRVTKGIARYGATNFSAPTAAFPTR